MQSTKQWVALAVLASLVVLTGGWYLLVAPTRSEAAELREQASLQEAANAQLETSLEVLRDRSERLPEKRAELAEAAVRIPAGPALPELLRALEGAAASAGVELSSVTPTAPSPVVVEAPVPAAPVDPAAAPAEPAAPAPPPAPAPAPTGLSAIDVTLAVVGDFYAVEQFVVLLEELPRALRVTGLTMEPGGSSLTDDPDRPVDQGSVQASITGRVFLVAPDATPPAGAPGAAPDTAGPLPGPPSESVS